MGSLNKLLEFLKEEWSLKQEQALISCKDCIDKYDGFVFLNGTFIHSNALPSLQEQKLKLIEEYARLSNLTFPKITYRKKYPKVFGMMDSFTPSPELVITIMNDDGSKKDYMPFDMSKLDFMFAQILKYLSENLPPINPIISVFADISINHRSLPRELSFLEEILEILTPRCNHYIWSDRGPGVVLYHY